MDQKESMPSKRILECWGCGEPAPRTTSLPKKTSSIACIAINRYGQHTDCVNTAALPYATAA